ncbi:MAG: alpha/beta hydrolase [Oleiphilaceae bacterium]|nr:alpha/beta hydrolase [Oleiphilaceae bacterium]
MKKWVFAAALLMVFTVSAQFVGEHYRYTLYDWAIDFETSRAGLEHKVAQIDGEPVAYLEGPRRFRQPSVVMLHGFGASKENWVRFAGKLQERFHLIALDLAGHGENPRDMSASYSVAAQTAFVYKVMQQLGIEQFHLVGNSMGGAISSLYAATYPEQVLSVVLISPAGVHDVPSKMEEMLEEGENPLIATSVPEFFELMDFVMEDKPYIPGPVARVEAEKAVSRAALNRKIFAELRADLETGMAERLRDVKAPALIIWGEQDRAIHVGNIDKYATLLPQAEKLVMPEVGHLAMIERPAQTAEAMLSFITRLESKADS